MSRWEDVLKFVERIMDDSHIDHKELGDIEISRTFGEGYHVTVEYVFYEGREREL